MSRHALESFEWLPGRLLREILEEAGDGAGSVALTGAALAGAELAAWTREAGHRRANAPRRHLLVAAFRCRP
jgi:hypothetical protein